MSENPLLVQSIQYWASLYHRVTQVNDPIIQQLDAPTLRWVIEMAYKYGVV